MVSTASASVTASAPKPQTKPVATQGAPATPRPATAKPTAPASPGTAGLLDDRK
jgi:hypothetical protein